MKSLVVALIALPFMAGAASAAQPLSDDQMDSVNGGFISFAQADAEGLGGQSSVLYAAGATLSQVTVAGIGSLDEGHSLLYKSVSAATSSSLLTTFPLQSIPGMGT